MTDSDDVLPDRRLRLLAILLAAMTLLLLIAGALVTSNEAGDSVPDWPLSFGRWLIQSNHFVANVRYEYSHRVIAASVGLITALLAMRAWRRERRPLIRRPALAMLMLLGCQVDLGVLAYAARLKSQFNVQPLEPMISLTVAHVVVGALTLASVVTLTLRCWRTLLPSRDRIGQTQISFNPSSKIIAHLLSGCRLYRQ